MTPLFPRFVLGKAPEGQSPHMVCHVLLVESHDALILIDSGFGQADVTQPNERLGREFRLMTRARLDVRETAIQQIQRLGYSPRDVRHVVLTHLDLDHAGGLSDFPDAKIHVFRREYEAAMNPTTSFERLRYRPLQWAHGPHWEQYETRGESWEGFEAVRDLNGLPPEILLVPLFGHSRGHGGVAIRVGQGWILHCGDAYFHHTEVTQHPERCPAMMRGVQTFFQVDAKARLHNQGRLRALNHVRSPEVRLLCAHSAHEFRDFTTG